MIGDITVRRTTQSAIVALARRHALVVSTAGMFLLLCGIYAFSIDIRASRGASITGDEPFYLLTTQSLIRDGDLDLRDQYGAHSYREFFDHPDELWMQSVPTVDGRLLSPHDPGLSVLVVPGYLAGGLVGVQVQLLLMAALAFALTYVLVRRMVGRATVAWLSTLAVAVAATPFIYATEVYPEVPAALALVGALLVIGKPAYPPVPSPHAKREKTKSREVQDPPLRYATRDRYILPRRFDNAHPPSQPSPLEGEGVGQARPIRRGLLLALLRLLSSAYPGWEGQVTKKGLGVVRSVVMAVLLTGMVWLGVKYAALAVPVAGYFLWRADWGGRVALAGLGALSAVGYVWFHVHTFGELTPYHVNVVYAGMSTAETVQAHVSFLDRAYRLYGLFIDERFGVGRWAPVLLATLPVLPFLWRLGVLGRLVLGLVCVQVLVATFVAITMMGWWFPGRTLMTVLPLFALPLAVLGVRAGWKARAVLVGLAAYSGLVTLALAAAGRAREVTIAVDPFNMETPLFQAMAPLFPDYRAWTWETVALSVGWVAVWGVGVWVVGRGAVGRERPLG